MWVAYISFCVFAILSSPNQYTIYFIFPVVTCIHLEYSGRFGMTFYFSALVFVFAGWHYPIVNFSFSRNGTFTVKVKRKRRKKNYKKYTHNFSLPFKLDLKTITAWCVMCLYFICMYYNTFYLYHFIMHIQLRGVDIVENRDIHTNKFKSDRSLFLCSTWMSVCMCSHKILHFIIIHF